MGYSPWGHKECDRTEQLTLSVFCLFVCLLSVNDRRPRPTGQVGRQRGALEGTLPAPTGPNKAEFLP